MDYGPLNSGKHRRMEITPKGVTPQPLKFSDKITFNELCKEYTLYSAAALIIFGGLPFDPISQFYSTQNLSEVPMVIMTDEPIFTGLETNELGATFNHLLMAIPNKLWKAMALHLGTLGIADKKTNTYFGTEIQKLPMPDYLALRKCTVLPHPVPMIDIYTVALDGNKTCLHFQPAQNPPLDIIRFVRSEPRKQVVQYAEAYFGGHLNGTNSTTTPTRFG